MVRLVFRPYTKLCKAICTSAHVRASTRVSSGFALVRHSSPSFGSHRTRSLEQTRLGTACFSLSLRRRVWHPPTRAGDGLLGPCFKTGRLRRMARGTRTDAGGNSVRRAERGPTGSRPRRRRKRFRMRGFGYFSLSFQSPFQLSLTVLLRYRIPAGVQPWMALTTLWNCDLKQFDSDGLRLSTRPPIGSLTRLRQPVPWPFRRRARRT